MARKVVGIVGLVLLVLATSGAGLAQRSDTSEWSARLGLEPVWSFPLPRPDPRDGVVAAQLLDSDLLVVQTRSAAMHVLDARSGLVRWRVNLGKPFQAYQRPAIATQRMVIVPVDLNLVAYERQSGVRLWQVELRDLPETAPACDDWQLVAIEGTTRMRCWFLPDIERLLSGSTTSAVEAKPGEASVRSVYRSGASSYEIRRQVLREPARLWDFDDPVGYSVPPVCAHHVYVAFVNREGKLRVVSSQQHQLVSEWQLPADASAPMTLQLVERPGEKVVSWESWLLVPCRDRAVYAYILQQGKLAAAWQRVLGDFANAPPITLGSDVLVTTSQRGTFCLDRDQGQIRWQQAQAQRFVAASPRMVLALDRQGQILALDRRDGRILAMARPSYSVRMIPNYFSDRLYLLDAREQLHCLRDRDPQCAEMQVYRRLLFAPPPPKEKKATPEVAAEKTEEKAAGNKP